MKFYVIGLDDNRQQHFKPEIAEVIDNHVVFSGGVRHHEIVAPYLPEGAVWIDIKVPLKKVFGEYERYDEIVVFASGDPLFFGFANTIHREMPEAEIVLFPLFHSLQLLAHRLLLPYQEMHIVSLTGRPWEKLDEALINGQEMIGVLTDSKEHTPRTIAGHMLRYGYDNYTISVGELLGNRENEKVSTLSPEEVAGREFAFPNNLILQKEKVHPRPFGIPESEFHLLDGRANMITKMPIRLLSLSLLDLREKRVFWDIGFCTGSFSIEAKLQFPHLQIVAFEKREEGRELMEANARKFGTPGIRTVIGDFVQEDLSAYPRPEAVFIGGHGGKMDEIIEKTAGALLPEGVIIFNSVSEDSRRMFREALEKNQLELKQEIEITIDHFNKIHVMKGGAKR